MSFRLGGDQHHLVSIGRGGAAVNFADLIGLLVLPYWFAQHITGGVGRCQLSAQFVQWDPIIVSNRYDVALSPGHARYLFVKHDRFAIAD